jgi:hypothetical protein
VDDAASLGLSSSCLAELENAREGILDAAQKSADIERRNTPTEGHMFLWAMAAMVRDGW